MNFNKFKRQYKAMANAETPDVPVVPQVTETAKPRLSQRPAFRFAMAALSLLLVVGISLTAVYIAPKSNVGNVVTAEGKPALTRFSSYEELDARLADAKDKYNSKINTRDIMWKTATAASGIDDLDFGNAEPAEQPDAEYHYAKNGSLESVEYTVDETGKKTEYSGTNVQVDGVDEADIVKTDGEFVYVTKDGKVLVFDVRDPANVVQSSTINVDKLLNNSVYGYARVADMFLEGNLLTVVFSAEKETYKDTRLYTDYYFGMRSDFEYGVAVYDVSDPASPESVRYYTQEGSYVSSRRIGDYVYIITNKYFYVGDYDGSPKDVVPCRCDSVVSNGSEPLAPDCIYFGEDTSNFLTLGAVNIKDASEPAGTVTVMGGGRTVYASLGAIYVFCDTYREAEATDDGAVTDIYDGDYGYVVSGEIMTDIYKFTIDGSELAFAASGSVRGSMINQFAADEYEGNLRVATNYEGYVTKEDKTVDFFSENGITILDENLDKLGELTGLAKGEYIKSVRFNGATGYVVTFRTVDPLFAFDLSDPKNPVVTGELKIPGYSEYMHVYDENTLIGIGQDATAESEDADIAYYQGLKIALFDVTDPDNMSEIDTFYLGDRGTTSAVEWDHKALAYYGERDVFGLPVELFTFKGEQKNIYDYGEFDGYSFCVFSMGGGEKIELVSQIQQLRAGAGDGEDKTLDITRGIFIGDNVVTISDQAIQINDFTTGEQLSRYDFVDR